MTKLANTLLYYDTKWFRFFFHSCDRKHAITLFRYITKSGDGYLYPVMGFVFIVLGFDQATQFFSASLHAFAAELFAYKLLKNRFKRQRPFESMEGIHCLYVPPDKFSFPSGHTAAAFLFYFNISFYYPALAPWFLLWAILIALSRVVLGLHYPSDLIAGLLLGKISSLTGLYLASL